MIKLRKGTALRQSASGNILARTEMQDLELEGVKHEESVDGWTKLSLEFWVMDDRFVPEVEVFPWAGQISGPGKLNRNECGLASAQMLMMKAGVSPPPINILSDKYDPPDDGTTAMDVQRCLNDFGVKARVYVVDLISQLEFPSIFLHLYRWRRDKVYVKDFYRWHWGVVYKKSNGLYYINDPLFPDGQGQGIAVTEQELAECWVPYSPGGKLIAVTYSNSTGSSKMASPQALPPEVYSARSENPFKQ
jgi:Peptidase C39 family